MCLYGGPEEVYIHIYLVGFGPGSARQRTGAYHEEDILSMIYLNVKMLAVVQCFF